MASTSPARVDDDLFSSAKLAGAVQSRSASQQVVHWARIGREIEASPSIATREIAHVLAGSRPYDDLSAKEQAIVRAQWSSRIDQFRDALNLAEEFSAAGQAWVELDESGDVVERAEPSMRCADVTADRATEGGSRRRSGANVGEDQAGSTGRSTTRAASSGKKAVKSSKSGRAARNGKPGVRRAGSGSAG